MFFRTAAALAWRRAGGGTLAAAATATAALAPGAAHSSSSPSSPAPDASSSYAYVPPPSSASAARAAAAAAAALPRARGAQGALPRVLFVLGGPGAGKGTQCARLAAEYGFTHLSAGDLLREERARGGPDAEMIEAFIREGKIVPVAVTVKLLAKAMDAAGAAGAPRLFLVDGFPRSLDNLAGWDADMAGRAVVDGVLLFAVPEDVMVARLLKRGESSGRSDDNAESIRKRLRTYRDATMPVVDAFARAGKVTTLDGARPVEEVTAAARAAVEPVVAAEALDANARLLRAIADGDWDAYAALAEPAVESFEADVGGGAARVAGHAPHKAAFEAAARARAAGVLAGGGPPAWKELAMHDAKVTLLGRDAALVTYVRHAGPAGAPPATAAGETRVWRRDPATGAWRNHWFHNGPRVPL